MKSPLPHIKILDIDITDASKEDILEYVFTKIAQKNEKFYLVTPNPEFLVFAKDRVWLRNLLNKAEISLADGVGLGFAAKILGKKMPHRFTGVEFVKKFCEKAANQPITIGFLGAGSKIATKAADRLSQDYPGVRIILFEDGNPDEKTVEMIREKMQKDADRYIFRENNEARSSIDMLFVAFGFPKQEMWIAQHLAELPVTAAMGVGGAFDYLAGEVPYAPAWIRNLGFEWLFRLITQPWRVKRQLALPIFVFLVLKERFFAKR